MITRTQATVTIALLSGAASAFHPAQHPLARSAFAAPPARAPVAALNAGAAISFDNEDEAMEVMLAARDCANSDSCSIDDAQMYIDNVVAIQADCVAGNYAGQQFCDDVAAAAEIVSGLRYKIQNGRYVHNSLVGGGGGAWRDGGRQPTHSICSEGGFLSFFSNRTSHASLLPLLQCKRPPLLSFLRYSALSNSKSANGMQQTSILAAGLVCAVVLAAGMAGTSAGGDAVPFTAQEVWWAARDGYIGDLMSHYLRNGGLSVPDSDLVSSGVSALTPQEWWWAARDGYLDDAVSHVSRYGGILLGDASSADAVSPFTGQEWGMAARDGYLGNMFSAMWKNGGI